MQRLRALEGICGECSNVELQFDHNQGKDRVGIRCTVGYSPIVLYENTPLGGQASCDGYDKRTEK